MAGKVAPRRVLLVAERFNLPRNARWEGYVEMNVRHWVRVAIRCGVFRRGHTSAKLGLIGVTWDEALNLLPPAPQGERWDPRAARRVAEVVLEDRRQYSHVFLCGRKVAQAMGHGRWPMLHSAVVSHNLLTHVDQAPATCKVMLVPHPSGLNRFWNDDVEIEVARDMVQEFLG